MPLLHSAATGVAAYAAIAITTVIRRAIAGSGVAVLSLLLLGQIAVSVALLAGYVAMRRSTREVAE
jgi:ABC-type branched-subunit amino acid transport system permease subunit